jgi:acetylornithine deacetylase/succinyl-diaminopimelate desuccinylase-like protein
VVELHELPGRTPVLLVDVPAAGDAAADPGAAEPADCVLLYGHLDKQPPFEGWRDGLGPWEPVIDGDRLYGRGAADDGYSIFAALTAIEAVREAGGSHARCVVLIEASEESGSPDLPAHLEALGDRLGTPSLVIGLDSGCADWERLWVTTSLRGMIDLVLRVDILTEGVHSGNAGGVVPSSFRILRNLLERIEDADSGELTLPELQVEIPPHRAREAATTAAELGTQVATFPLVPGAHSCHERPEERILARTWKASMEVVGLDGAPPTDAAGNVLRPSTSAKLSIRVPPTADAQAAAAAVVKRLRDSPPYGASVTVTPGTSESGWHAPDDPPWLSDAMAAASTAAFGAPPGYMGEGGTIPFMGMLGRTFPDARFVVTGVLGPGSNAHGPNEFLHLPTARGITTSVAHLLDAHARRP